MHYFSLQGPILNVSSRYGFSKPINKRTKSFSHYISFQYCSLYFIKSFTFHLPGPLLSYLSLHWSGYEFSELIEGPYVIIILQVSFVLVCVSCMTPVYKARTQNSLSYKPWMRLCLWPFPRAEVHCLPVTRFPLDTMH